ncbi:MAG: sialate O-acetylesterase [Rhodothermales bacterium]
MRHRLVRGFAFAAAALAIFALGAISQCYNVSDRIASLFADVPDFAIPESLQGRLHIFILAGQSNMEGHASLEGYVPPPPPIAERLFIFTQDYTWQTAREPLNPAGVGPSVAFAAEVARDEDVPVGLVPVARGGTSIRQWQASRRDGSLYAEMIKRALAASHQGEIKGLLFFQGEREAQGDSTDRTSIWSEAFERFAGDVRRNLGRPRLPIVFAQIGPNSKNLDRWRVVQEEQATVDLPHTAMIITANVPGARGIHFSAQGYLEIGRRFARAYRRIASASTDTLSALPR